MRVDGVWQRGWCPAGERLAVWQHRSGAVWAWELTLSKAGTTDGAWALAVIGSGAPSPPTSEDIPNELRNWVMEPQLGC